MAPSRFFVLGAALACLLFTAAPARAVDEVIAAAGDIACDPAHEDFESGDGVVDACRQKYTSDLLVGAGLSSVLVTGDVQYEDGTLAKFMGSYDLSWGRVKSITRPAIGNHEYQNGTLGAGYWDYFNGPGTADGLAGPRDKGWYSFDIGEWHLIALNSMCHRVGGCDLWSEQEQWLRADLAANSDACTVAYWHHPLFNSGPDGNYNDDPQNNTTALWQALYEAGADLALAGHAHTWQHYAPQDAAGNADAAFGLREFIIGTGGKNLTGFGPVQPNLVARDDTLFGVMKFVLEATSYDWSFVAETTGATPHTGTSNCHGAPPDTFQPDTRLSSGPQGLTRERNASFAFRASEPAAGFRCRLDGPGAATGTETACASPQSYTGLGDGAYTFTVKARDGAGNEDQSPVTQSFTVDGTAPDTSISDGPSGTVSSTSATFSFGASEGGAALECRLDGAAFVSCSSPQTYDNLAEGSHTFETRATDAAGNTDPSPAARTFTVDIPDPELPPATPATDEPPPTETPPTDEAPLRLYRPMGYEITSGRVYRGRRSKRRLYVNDGSKLEIAAAEKRSGAYVSAFYALLPIGPDTRDTLQDLTVTYNGGTSARNGRVAVYVFNHRTRRWVEIFTRKGRRDRTVDWAASAFAADYVSSKGSMRVRVRGTRAEAFRTRTDLIEVAVGFGPLA